MAGATQRIQGLADDLEKHICEQLNISRPAGVLRRMKVNQILLNANKHNEIEYSQACSYFAEQAASPQAFDANLSKLQAKGDVTHKQFLAMLHVLATDPELEPLRKVQAAKGQARAASAAGPGAAPAASKQSVTAALRGSGAATAAPAPQAAAPAAASVAAAAAAPMTLRQQQQQQQQQQLGITNITPAGANSTGVAAASSYSAQQLAGFSTPMASMPAVATPKVGDGGMQAALKQGAAGARQGPQGPVGAAANNKPVFYGKNPVFGQEDAHSPLVRSRDYTPTLTESMAAARNSNKRMQEPRAAVPAPGDLFVPGALGAEPVAVAAPWGSPTPATPVRSTWQHEQEQATQAVLNELMQLVQRVPAWNSDRPYLTGQALIMNAVAGGPGQGLPAAARDSLSILPPSMQEIAVMNDLLYAFMGHGGTYIRARLIPAPGAVEAATAGTPAVSALGGGQASGKPTLTFTVDADLEPCLLEMVERVLPICEYVVVLQRFIETRSSYQYPMVFHAVAAALRSLLSDWLLLVTQLEHQLRLGQLNLQALTFHCQGPMASLKLLASVAAEAASRRLTAAGLLNLLHAKSAALVGDQQGRALVQRLLMAGAAPYFQILERWLREGVLDDPHAEFMVQENKAINKEDLTADRNLAYWHNRYTLRQAPHTGVGPHASSVPEPASTDPQLTPEQLDIPVFLQGHADMILTTGKYLNVIRECGQHAPQPDTGAAKLQFDQHGAYVQHIAAAHGAASSSLLQLLVGDRHLLTLLRSIKHYFLLDQGDVLVHLIETAQEELGKPTRDFSTTRLQSLLELAVKTSSAASDPMSDNLGFEMDPRSVVELAKLAARAGRAGSQRGDRSVMGMSVGTPASVTSNVRKIMQRQQSTKQQERDKDKEDRPAWDFFLLNYRVSWPYTLVVPPCQLSQYQLVFKLLLVLKLTERQLSVTWHRVASGSRTRDKGAISERFHTGGRVAGRDRGAAEQAAEGLPWSADELYLVYSLGQRFMFFVQEFLRYATFDVLEPMWSRMEAAIRKATNVDQVVQLHRSFLEHALDGLLLTQHPRILRLLWSISQLAQAYCKAANTELDAHERRQQGLSRQAQPPQQGDGPHSVDGMAGIHTILNANLQTLLQELQQLYDSLMRREGAGAEAVESMQAEELAESRDELGRLQCLIERLGSAQAAAKGKAAAPVTLAALSLHAR